MPKKTMAQTDLGPAHYEILDELMECPATETDLSAKLHMGATKVRDAIRLLKVHGMVRIWGFVPVANTQVAVYEPARTKKASA